MKTTLSIILLLISVSLTSCTNKEDSYPPPPGLNFSVDFVNGEGRSLVPGLKTTGDSHSEISKHEYNYKLFVNEKEVLPSINLDPLININSDDPKYLDFRYNLYPTGGNMATFQLICPHIFGNGETNTITAVWSTFATPKERIHDLIDLQFNGKSIPRELEEDYSYRYKILVE